MAVVAAVLTGYRTGRGRTDDLKVDSAEVVRIAVNMAEATATFSPEEPMAAIDRAAALMVPEQATTFKDQFGKATTDLAHRNVTATASTMEAGLEAIGRSGQRRGGHARHSERTGSAARQAVLALRVALTKQSGHWLVLGVSPLNPR